MSHLAKVIKPNAVRIESTFKSTDASRKGLYFSVFLNPDHSFALVVQNDANEPVKTQVTDGSRHFTVELLPKSINSYRWK